MLKIRFARNGWDGQYDVFLNRTHWLGTVRKHRDGTWDAFDIFGDHVTWRATRRDAAEALRWHRASGVVPTRVAELPGFVA